MLHDMDLAAKNFQYDNVRGEGLPKTLVQSL